MLQRIVLVIAGVGLLAMGGWSLVSGTVKTRNGEEIRGGKAVFLSAVFIGLGGYVIFQGLKETEGGGE